MKKLNGLHIIPILSDNYVFAIVKNERCVLVDPGEAAPVLAWLERMQLQAEIVLLTHLHGDHIGGVQALREKFSNVKVAGPKEYSACDLALDEKSSLEFAAESIQTLELPGHTLNHLGFVWKNVLFCGDVLFGLGSGRLFEGSPAQMLNSIKKIGI